MNWHEYFITIADSVALKSKDRSTKVSAVIVGPDHEIRSTGYNGFPRLVDDNVEERHDRPAKYMWTEHAERNAIYNAARCGIPLLGCTMYQNWAPTSCADCARAVIQAGITTMIGPARTFGGKGSWTESIDVGSEMMMEAGVVQWVYKDGLLILYREWRKEQDK